MQIHQICELEIQLFFCGVTKQTFLAFSLFPPKNLMWTMTILASPHIMVSLEHIFLNLDFPSPLTYHRKHLCGQRIRDSPIEIERPRSQSNNHESPSCVNA